MRPEGAGWGRGTILVGADNSRVPAEKSHFH